MTRTPTGEPLQVCPDLSSAGNDAESVPLVSEPVRKYENIG